MKIPIGLKKSAAMVLLRHQDEFLLLKRAKEPNKGLYVPVGGKLEPFEDPRSAAIRETKEETGITVDSLKYCGVLIESSPGKYNWQCNIYVADINRVPPPECDEGILEWIAYADVPQIPTPPTDWQIYQYIMAEKPFAMDAIYDKKMNLTFFKEELENKNLLDT